MSELPHIREMIQQGAPKSGEEARKLVEQAVRGTNSVQTEWQERFSSALMTILVSRALNQETFEARAQALAILVELEKRAEEAVRA